MTEEYLTMRDLEKLLGVTRITVYDWIRKGKFPQGMRVTKKTVRWTRSDVDNFLDGCRQPAV